MLWRHQKPRHCSLSNTAPLYHRLQKHVPEKVWKWKLRKGANEKKKPTQRRLPKYSYKLTQRKQFFHVQIATNNLYESENTASFSHLLRNMMAFPLFLPPLPLFFPFPICSSPPTPPYSSFPLLLPASPLCHLTTSCDHSHSRPRNLRKATVLLASLIAQAAPSDISSRSELYTVPPSKTPLRMY